MHSVEFDNVESFVDTLRANQPRITSAVEMAVESYCRGASALQGALVQFVVTAEVQSGGCRLELRHDCGELRCSENRTPPTTALVDPTIGRIVRACRDLGLTLWLNDQLLA
jgi:hypothetical protein